MTSISQDLFPHQTIRSGQDQLIKDIEQAIQEKKILLAHAPTGLGKTASALSVALQHALENKIIYISNGSKKYKIRNMYEVIQSLPDESVVVVYDGDDWFAHNNVLARIAAEYENKKIWVTYGMYQDEPGGKHAFSVSKESNFRKAPAVFNIVPGHPFTFYAWLFKRIAYEDFIVNGSAFPKAGSDNWRCCLFCERRLHNILRTDVPSHYINVWLSVFHATANHKKTDAVCVS